MRALGSSQARDGGALGCVHRGSGAEWKRREVERGRLRDQVELEMEGLWALGLSVMDQGEERREVAGVLRGCYAAIHDGDDGEGGGWWPGGCWV